MAALLERRRGLRLPLTATGFEGLCWAIIGQQINIAFASSLRRELLALCGTEIGDMRAHPSAERVAEIAVDELARRRFSRSKAEYLIGAAQPRLTAACTSRRWATDRPSRPSASSRSCAASARGPRATCSCAAPALPTARPWATSRSRPRCKSSRPPSERPGPEQVEALMRPFAPHRSLATLHLWASLKDTAKEAA